MHGKNLFSKGKRFGLDSVRLRKRWMKKRKSLRPSKKSKARLIFIHIKIFQVLFRKERQLYRIKDLNLSI